MSAPTIKQTSGLLPPSTPQTASTLTLPVWPGTTTTANRDIVVLSITNNGTDGITATCSDGTAYSETINVRRLSGGHDEETLYVFQRLNITGSTARPVITFTGLPTGGVYVTAVAYEVAGSDTALETDIPPTGFIGAASAFTVGPAGPSSRGDVLWLAAVATPNINAVTITSPSPFTQVTAGPTSGTGDPAKAHLLVAVEPQTSAGSASMSVSVAGGLTRQYAAALIAIPGTSSSGGGGSSGSPRSFPLGPPDTTGYTHLSDPDPNAVWKPNLTNGVDYVLDCPVQRTREIQVIGGRNVVIPKLLIKLSQRDSEMVKYGGGDPDRLLHIDTFELDPNGFQCDAIQTSQPCSGRHIQLRTGFIRKLIGQTSNVHADLLQAAGGIGEVWVQDVEAATTYEGFQLQREAKLGPGVAKAITSLARSSTTVTVTCTGHGLSTGKYVSITGTSDSGFHGGQTVTGSADANHYTYELAITSGVGSSATGGTSQEMSFGYDVGGWHCLRYHMVGYPNGLPGGPASALGAFRIGARTAPVNNSHPNEDATRITDDAWNGTADFQSVYIEPPSGVTAGNFVNPGSAAGVWSVVRATVSGSTVTYPGWSKVSGSITVGAPGTPFVVMQNGVPVSTTTGGTTLPAPVNTTLPTITPADPQAGTILNWTVGVWDNTDTATTYSVALQRRLGTSGSYSTVQTTSQTGPAPGTYQTAAGVDDGYQFRVTVTPNNGTAGAAASSLPTNVLLSSAPITMTIVVE